MSRSTWVLDEGKFLSTKEVLQLEHAVENRLKNSSGAARAVAARDRMILDLALFTGLRVAELAALTCGDILIENGRSSLVVRRGKGGKTRSVRFNGQLKRSMMGYLKWKEEHGEPVDSCTPVLRSARTGEAMTTRAIQKAFKRCASAAGLSPHYSIHALRHTYACHLYRASGYNLRLVQKQLGHSHISTTQVYADVMEPDMQRAIERLYGKEPTTRRRP
jgi:site-specific recombinase XerD